MVKPHQSINNSLIIIMGNFPELLKMLLGKPKDSYYRLEFLAKLGTNKSLPINLSFAHYTKTPEKPLIITWFWWKFLEKDLKILVWLLIFMKNHSYITTEVESIVIGHLIMLDKMEISIIYSPIQKIYRRGNYSGFLFLFNF